MSDYHLHRLSRLQILTARNMHRAMQETAHATLHSECDVTSLVEGLGKQPNGRHINISTYVLQALVHAIQEHPAMNAHLATDELCVYNHIKLGLMVESRHGVMIACIPNAETKSASELESAIQDMRSRARHGRLDLSETRGATFMVADFSAYPVDTFTPILLPSAIAILGIGRVRPACLPTAEGFRAAHLLSLSLTFDHRGTNGLAASRFMATLIHRLEEPE